MFNSPLNPFFIAIPNPGIQFWVPNPSLNHNKIWLLSKLQTFVLSFSFSSRMEWMFRQISAAIGLPTYLCQGVPTT